MTPRPQEKLEHFFLIVFSIEAAMKIIATASCSTRTLYPAQRLNVLTSSSSSWGERGWGFVLSLGGDPSPEAGTAMSRVGQGAPASHTLPSRHCQPACFLHTAGNACLLSRTQQFLDIHEFLSLHYHLSTDLCGARVS